MTELRATFATTARAQRARDDLVASGVPSSSIVITDSGRHLTEETARESRTMGRIVVVIVLASIIGTALGAAMGGVLHVLVGPEGTSGLIIQVVSWAIFAHLLIGMWAGYLLLADRTEREIGRAEAVTIVIRCANIDADTVRAQLRRLGATHIREGVPAAPEGRRQV